VLHAAGLCVGGKMRMALLVAVSAMGFGGCRAFVRPVLRPLRSLSQLGRHPTPTSAQGAEGLPPLRATVGASTGVELDPRVRSGHPYNNVPIPVAEKVNRQLHRNPNHPLGIIKHR
jgi:hypothetical protein